MPAFFERGEERSNACRVASGAFGQQRAGDAVVAAGFVHEDEAVHCH